MFEEVEYLLITLKIIDEKAPESVATWYREGLEKYKSGSDSLEKCLGLAGKQGSDKFIRQYNLFKRNTFLKKSWDFCEAESDWTKSGVLADEIKKFKLISEALKETDVNISELSNLRSSLYIASKYGDLPESQRQVHDIVRAFARSNKQVAADSFFSTKLVHDND